MSAADDRGATPLAWDASLAPLALGDRYDDGVLASNSSAVLAVTRHLSQTLDEMLQEHPDDGRAVKLTRFDSSKLEL